MNKERYGEICSKLKNIICNTEYEGHVFTVGGCVRDTLLKLPIKDIDLVVDLPNGGINFANWLEENGYITGTVVVYPTYGTAMFKLKDFPSDELEVVQTRKEQYKDKGSRNPETCYGTLEEDCLRRDLTINAMYWDITNEKFIDLVGGIDDIENKIIKTPSDPQIVFDDDPLRMMRVIRFATRFGWKINDETLASIKYNAERLKIITQERITDEVCKSYKNCAFATDILTYYIDCGLIKYIFPELAKEFSENKPLYTDIQKMIRANDKRDDITFIFAILFHFMKLNDVREIMCRMKFSNKDIEKTVSLIDFLKYRNIETNLNPAGVREMQYKYKNEDIFDLHLVFLNLYEKCAGSYFNHSECIREINEYISKTKTEMYNYALPLNGYHLMEIGYRDIQIKNALKLALIMAFTKPSITKDEIIYHLKSIKNV